jgi:hypothetical protein
MTLGGRDVGIGTLVRPDGHDAGNRVSPHDPSDNQQLHWERIFSARAKSPNDN